MNIKPTIIVAGEPYSIFLEIFFKAISKNNFNNPIILIVSKNLLIKQMKKFNYNFKINLLNKNKLSIRNLDNNQINIIDVNFKFKKIFDKISKKSNIYIEECFKIALTILNKNVCSGLINGPISKKNFLKQKFLGITEYLAKKSNIKKKVAMLIYNKKLSVSPITTHLPLKEVHKNITKNRIINNVKLINQFYKKKFKKKPKIAVTGLNPHCESNYKSSEEDKIIIPAIKYLKKAKFKVSGPFAADTIFLKEKSNEYDVIVGMYHDQVLTPVKTLFGFNAINITLGLPFIRISPDHGPNVHMLGQNLSNPKSLIEAINFLENK
jgi:4-hydroxythreonine-4-phosphate dehydrogenase